MNTRQKRIETRIEEALPSTELTLQVLIELAAEAVTTIRALRQEINEAYNEGQRECRYAYTQGRWDEREEADYERGRY